MRQPHPSPYSNDAAGNVTSRRTRAGGVFAFGYDRLNRMTLRDVPGGEPDVSYAYDLLGRMLSATTSSRAVTNYGANLLNTRVSA